MQQRMTPKEAVRLTKEKLGEAHNTEIAAYIQQTWGLTIKPPIVTVLLGTLQERANLDQTGEVARARIEQWKAENPEEAKKLAATVQKREAARRRKQTLSKGETVPVECEQEPVVVSEPTAAGQISPSCSP